MFNFELSSVAERKTIPLSEPEISGNEWNYIKECLDTGMVSSVGEYVERFEKVVAGYLGSKFAVATVNGTSALHLSLIVSGVQAGDEVIVPTLTFIAPVNAVRYCGASPVFMDCDLKTLCVDVQKVVDFIRNECVKRKDGFTYNKETKRRVKAVIPVNVFGHPVDIEPLLAVAGEYNISVVEDATESLGSDYKGKKTGTFGEAGCFSFNGNKIITTGGGGIVVTDDEGFADRVRHLSTQAKKGSIECDHDAIGYNYRLTNIQAAMGVAQMERLEEFVDVKRKNVSTYRELLSGLDNVEFILEQAWAKSNYWFCTIKIPEGEKEPLMAFLLSRDIQVRPVWKLIHTLQMYEDYQAYRIEKAFEAYDSCLSLPCSVNLKEADMAYVASGIAEYFAGEL